MRQEEDQVGSPGQDPSYLGLSATPDTSHSPDLAFKERTLGQDFLQQGFPSH